MRSIKEPEIMVPASALVHLVEAFRHAHLMASEGEYGTTSEMYNDLRDRAVKRLAEFDRKTWRN